jgi:multidrug efflux pump subunit AcrA (membrane-fusion protein)
MMWLAAEAVTPPSWLTLPNTLAIIGALSPVVLLVIGKRLSTQVEESNSRKTDAEARKTDADAARELIAEARQIMADKETLAEAKIERVRAEASVQVERVRAQSEREAMEARGRLSRLELDLARLQRTLAVHIPWDVEAWSRIRIMDPNFPEPPAIDHQMIESVPSWQPPPPSDPPTP